MTESVYASSTNNSKLKTTHRVSFTFFSESGSVKSIMFVIHQFNTKNGLNKIINLNHVDSMIVMMDLKDGSYSVIVSGKIITNGGPTNAGGNLIFTIDGKDQIFKIKLKPIEGMA